MNFGPGVSVFQFELLLAHRERVLTDRADICDAHAMKFRSDHRAKHTKRPSLLWS